MNPQETIQLLKAQIEKLKKERDVTYQPNIRESITDDIKYYQNQIQGIEEQLFSRGNHTHDAIEQYLKDNS